MEEELKKKERTKEQQEKLEELKKRHERRNARHENKEEKDRKDEMIKSLSENVQELENKLLYNQAEFANFKKRREEETRNMLKYQNFDIAKELLPILDSLERALSVREDMLSDDVKKYLSGFKIMYNNLINVLNKFEIKEIDCLNKEFDANFEQALMTEHKDGVNGGIVIEVLQKGYIIKDKLLRAALVKVSE